MSSDQEPTRFELIELETFIAVAELGSFSLAAKRLHVTQPSVTNRVKRLEAALGAKLLLRTTRKAVVTPSGARLLAEATSALSGLRTLGAMFRQQARQARQRVVMASTPLLSAVRLPPLIRAYSERFTDVQVQLSDLHYPDVLAALEVGTADLAIIAFEGDTNRFEFEPLWREDLVLVALPDHPLAGLRSVSPEDIATYPLLVIEQHEPMRQRIARRLRRRGLSLPPSIPARNLTTLIGMLHAGMGVTLLPRSVGNWTQQMGCVVIDIAGIDLNRNFGILLSRKNKLGTAAQSFCRYLREIVKSS